MEKDKTYKTLALIGVTIGITSGIIAIITYFETKEQRKNQAEVTKLQLDRLRAGQPIMPS